MIKPVILAVDDRKDNLFILNQLISSSFKDSILYMAESAAEGLEIARECKLDVVLTDVQMPGMNGIEFCRTLKSSPATADSIVLMLTAHKPDPKFIAEGLDAGAFDFISKPIDNLELLARINAALRIKKAENQLKSAYNRLDQKITERTIELENANLRLQNEIKEREQAENALRESNQRIMTAMKGMEEGLWDLDLVTGKVTYDENWARVLGYDSCETEFGRDWWDEQIHPDYVLLFKSAMSDYLSGREKYFEIEYRIKTKQGNLIWVWARGVCVAFDKDRNPLRMIGTQRNITAKRKVEEDFQQLITAIEQVEDVIIITDSNANIVYVNPSFEKVTGFEREKVMGLNPRILKSGVHSPEFYINMWQQLSSGEVWSGRMVNKRKNGALYDEEATITPIRNIQGEISNFIAVKRDVTLQVKLEQQLRQAQKMEAIGTLAGGIAHDFNNILFAIQGYNSLSLRLLETSHPTYSHLQKLGQAAERAKDLVSQILTFSRQSEQKLRPLLMQPVIKEALNLLRATIPTTIDVNQNINPDGGLIQGDVTHIHQIIINLATNAYQAMRKNGGVLSVSLNSIMIDSLGDIKYQGMKPGMYAELKVSDTGCGMDHNTMERIFEPYFSTKDQGDGTGMGLSIVHGIITTYGGKIFVESEKDKGTTFQVLIPEITTSLEADEKDESFDELELKGSEKIIVVDDEVEIAEMLKNMLEELGYEVDAYTSSEEVLNDFRQDPQQTDLIITDMTMPRMTGAVLSARLLEIRPTLPIILCTGYSESMDEQSAKELGIREFIYKPISYKSLAKTVKSILTEMAKS